jgi:hypothetical protein
MSASSGRDQLGVRRWPTCQRELTSHHPIALTRRRAVLVHRRTVPKNQVAGRGVDFDPLAALVEKPLLVLITELVPVDPLCRDGRTAMKVEELGHEPRATLHDEETAILGAVVVEIDESLGDEKSDTTRRLVDVLPGTFFSLFGRCREIRVSECEKLGRGGLAEKLAHLDQGA